MDLSKENIKKTFFVFDGRLSQPEFLKLFLILLGVSILAGFVIGILGFIFALIHLAFLVFVVYLAVVIPLCVAQVSIVIRRWHDLGKSGWYTLLLFIPFIGIIVLIYLLIAKTPGTPPTV